MNVILRLNQTFSSRFYGFDVVYKPTNRSDSGHSACIIM